MNPPKLQTILCYIYSHNLTKLQWIPILNILLMLEIAELPLWYILLLLVPCVNIGIIIYTWWRIAEKRGKPGPAAIGLIVPVVGFFIVLWIAFSD